MSTAFEMPETMDFINDLFNDAAPPMPDASDLVTFK